MKDAYLRDWQDRWRYPELGLTEAADADVALLGHAILDGILAPVADQGEAARRLLAIGYFDDAASLAADDVALQTAVERAREEALQTAGRIAAELTGRARRAGIPAEPPPGFLDEVRHSLRAFEGHAAAWRSRIEDAERRRTAELEARLDAAGDRITATREAAVRRCLRLLEFGAAELLIDTPEDDEAALGPEAFPRLPAWPWGARLDWYLDAGSEAPPRFHASWKPPADDSAAWRVVYALDALSRSPAPETARKFADELDALLGNEGDTHWVDNLGEGLLTSIAGLQEPWLPDLALPHRFPLWFSPAGAIPPDDLERPVIWLVLDGSTPSPPPGVAALPVTTLLLVLAPDQGQPLTEAARKIAVLRAVCRQLRLADVIGPGDGLRFGGAHGWRRDLSWLLDLLGVRVSEGALDIIAYDTGSHPLATRAVLEGLLPDDARPDEITGESLIAWHREQAVVARFRDRVLGVVFRDVEVAAVITAALWMYGGSPGQAFTSADVEEALDALAEEEFGRLPGAEPDMPYLYMPRALDKALGTGLLTHAAGSGYEFGPPGLIGLLAGDADYLMSRARAAITELNRRRELVKKSMRSRLTMEAVRHLFDNHLTAFAALAGSLSEWRTRLPAELTEKVNFAISHYERMEDYRRAAEVEALEELQRPREFDLGVLLTELRDERSDRRIIVSVDWDGAPLMVRASRFMVKMAFENLIVNALRAIAESNSPRGRIQLTAARFDDPAGAGGPEAVVDVRDTGPGIAAELLTMLGEDFGATISGEVGSGLPQAGKLLDHWGGSLVPLATNSDLGGAHFQVRLPLAQAR